jgi:TolA-binding protein
VSFFQRVMSEQPDGNKVPDAMLKMSLAYDRVGRGAEATRLLDDLNRQYPATNAGRLASQRLAERK